MEYCIVDYYNPIPEIIYTGNLDDCKKNIDKLNKTDYSIKLYNKIDNTFNNNIILLS